MKITDLISRSAVLEMEFCAIKPTHDCQSVVSVVNAEDIEKLPAIDAVPVVRCKDCKHWGTDWVLGETEQVKCCNLAEYMVGANGYCVYGEKSEEDTDESQTD